MSTTPPSSSSPVTWEPHSEASKNYLYIQNDVTEVREDLRPLETSFWNNYIAWLTRGPDLHKDWEWDGPAPAPAESRINSAGRGETYILAINYALNMHAYAF